MVHCSLAWGLLRSRQGAGVHRTSHGIAGEQFSKAMDVSVQMIHAPTRMAPDHPGAYAEVCNAALYAQ